MLVATRGDNQQACSLPPRTRSDFEKTRSDLNFSRSDLVFPRSHLIFPTYRRVLITPPVTFSLNLYCSKTYAIVCHGLNAYALAHGHGQSGTDFMARTYRTNEPYSPYIPMDIRALATIAFIFQAITDYGFILQHLK